MNTEGQDSFDYLAGDLVTFEKYISSDRLAAYILYARGDKWTAIRLYERNTELSEALYGVLQSLEVTLRNAIHELMTKKLGSANWYDSFAFQDSELSELKQAKEKVIERAVIITPGRIIAELKFGFWVRLFSHAYDKNLWVPHLRTIFPIRLDGKRAFVHGRLVELRRCETESPTMNASPAANAICKKTTANCSKQLAGLTPLCAVGSNQQTASRSASPKSYQRNRNRFRRTYRD